MSDIFSQSAAQRLLPKEAGWRDPDEGRRIYKSGIIFSVEVPRPTQISEEILDEIRKRIGLK